MRVERGTLDGFTLIELAVALAVAGVLALTAAPPIARYIQDYRLEGAASNLVGDLHLLRHRAVAEGNNYVMLLDPDNDCYTIFDDDNNNDSLDDGENVIGPVELPHGLTLKNGPWLPFPNDTVSLRPNGTANSTGIITITNNKGRQRLLFLLSSTGFAKKLWEYQTEIQDH
jgi:prepilin-type N-terminal cleavage/methylation domain-containing protein